MKVSDKYIKRLIKQCINEAKTQYSKAYVVDEGDGIYNVILSDELDKDGYLDGYNGQRGYHIDDFDIVKVFYNADAAFRCVDKLRNESTLRGYIKRLVNEAVNEVGEEPWGKLFAGAVYARSEDRRKANRNRYMNNNPIGTKDEYTYDQFTKDDRYESELQQHINNKLLKNPSSNPAFNRGYDSYRNKTGLFRAKK